MPAGLVLIIVVGALLLAMFVNADATLRKSQGKRGNAEWRQSVAHDVASVADFFHLTAPRTQIDSAMGRQHDEKVGGNLDELLQQQQSQLAARRARRARATRPAPPPHRRTRRRSSARRRPTTRCGCGSGVTRSRRPSAPS